MKRQTFLLSILTHTVYREFYGTMLFVRLHNERVIDYELKMKHKNSSFIFIISILHEIYYAYMIYICKYINVYA